MIKRDPARVLVLNRVGADRAAAVGQEMRDPPRPGPVGVPVLVALVGRERCVHDHRAATWTYRDIPHPRGHMRGPRVVDEIGLRGADRPAGDARDPATAGSPQRAGAIDGVVDARQHVARMAVGERERDLVAAARSDLHVRALTGDPDQRARLAPAAVHGSGRVIRAPVPAAPEQVQLVLLGGKQDRVRIGEPERSFHVRGHLLQRSPSADVPGEQRRAVVHLGAVVRRVEHRQPLVGLDHDRRRAVIVVERLPYDLRAGYAGLGAVGGDRHVPGPVDPADDDLVIRVTHIHGAGIAEPVPGALPQGAEQR